MPDVVGVAAVYSEGGENPRGGSGVLGGLWSKGEKTVKLLTQHRVGEQILPSWYVRESDGEVVPCCLQEQGSKQKQDARVFCRLVLPSVDDGHVVALKPYAFGGPEVPPSKGGCQDCK